MAYVRASGDLATVRDGYTRVIKALGHRSLRPFFITSSDWVDRALLRERFTAGLAAFAAALTSLLACMGVYGLLAYSVPARVREIGVRVALGAERGTVWRSRCPVCSSALRARGPPRGSYGHNSTASPPVIPERC